MRHQPSFAVLSQLKGGEAEQNGPLLTFQLDESIGFCNQFSAVIFYLTQHCLFLS
jgi:hypothetical protein